MSKRRPELPAMWSHIDPKVPMVSDRKWVDELRAAEAVIRAARSDPDPHHRVSRALVLLDGATGRRSKPGRVP